MKRASRTLVFLVTSSLCLGCQVVEPDDEVARSGEESGDGEGVSEALSTSCSHDKCSSGIALVSSCDPCVTSICTYDPYCCSTYWDSICVAEVASICGLSCTTPPPPGCGATTSLTLSAGSCPNPGRYEYCDPVNPKARIDASVSVSSGSLVVSGIQAGYELRSSDEGFAAGRGFPQYNQLNPATFVDGYNLPASGTYKARISWMSIYYTNGTSCQVTYPGGGGWTPANIP